MATQPTYNRKIKLDRDITKRYDQLTKGKRVHEAQVIIHGRVITGANVKLKNTTVYFSAAEFSLTGRH